MFTKKHSPLLIILVIVAMIFTMLPTTTMAAGGTGSSAAAYESGTKSAVSSTQSDNQDLVLYTADDLFAFAKDVNSGNNYSGKVVRLGADIDLKDAPWTPIGYVYSSSFYNTTKNHPFSGTFDGDGYTIKGLLINVKDTKSGGKGLFGLISFAAVKNVTVEGSVTADDYNEAGGIVGYADNSDVINCVNNASVSGSGYVGGIVGGQTGGTYGVYSCTNNGNVTESSNSKVLPDQCGGGIAGWSTHIACSTNHGTVSGGENYESNCYIGGIAGGSDTSVNSYSIDRCYNTGAVNANGQYVGGISGYLRYATVSNCYNMGPVSSAYDYGNAVNPGYVGGIVGGLTPFSGTDTSTLCNCYNRGDLNTTGKGLFTTGQVYGALWESTATNNYGSTDAVTAAKLGKEYAEDTAPQINGGCPVLAWQKENPSYTITFATDKGASITVKNSTGETVNASAHGTYSLTSGRYSYTAANGSATASGTFNVVKDNKTIAAYLTSGSKVTFAAVPQNADVTVKNSTGQTMTPKSDGSYALINGTYTYTASAGGCNTASGSFVVENGTRNIPVVLVESSKIYNVTEDSSITGGTVKVDPLSGTAGTPVTVTVAPDKGKRLVENSLKYTTDSGSSGYTAITQTNGVYSFILPGANVTITAQFEKIPTKSYAVTLAPVPDKIWTVTSDRTSAEEGDTVTVTVSDTSVSSWATGLVVTGASGKKYDFTTVKAATGNANNVNGPGIYSFVMPGEPVTVNFTADYTPLDVYVKIGSGQETLVHSYTRAEMEKLAAANTSPCYYAMWDRLPAAFMGKAVHYVTIPQLAASASTYNSAVHFNDSSCTMKGLSLDGWTTNLTWDYLMGTTRKYYAALGDPYLEAENRTGKDREVPPVLTITAWAGRQVHVDNQPYDTLNAYRLFYGLSASEYGDGSLPTADEMDKRCTANNTAKFINKLVFMVPQSYSAAVDSSIKGGSLKMIPSSGTEGTQVTVSVTPDSGKKLVSGSLKYTADGGKSYTPITAANGVYSFKLPAANVTVTAQFADAGASNYSATSDSSIKGGSLSISPGSGTAGTTVTVSVSPDSGKRLVYGSLKYTKDGGKTYNDINADGGACSFTLPAANVIVTAKFENIPAAVYTVIPQINDDYTIGSTSDGIKTMTVKSGINGLKYFRVNIDPVIAHSGLETAVFVHERAGEQLEINSTEGDFDLVSSASAGFNVQEGDVVKVYVVDKLTNDPNSNPIIFQ
ncbi:hypothetical protein CLRAG_34150 [Clostridium ragsdalei P11]|uniref:Bacterial repeat domain-containing protein n=1 Tax=Clostridium ragsdalei P11 TaxID=1353534 RepID=A0A1A6AL05_9CLOT|nr:hypothetical protein [Clostridium ragsdalei]OBR90767.1 hypothetical protein CLRAG_34150 [Clostridium ragsdalei P11]